MQKPFRINQVELVYTTEQLSPSQWRADMRKASKEIAFACQEIQKDVTSVRASGSLSWVTLRGITEHRGHASRGPFLNAPLQQISCLGGKRPTELSITHKSSTDNSSQFDIGQARHTMSAS